MTILKITSDFNVYKKRKQQNTSSKNILYKGVQLINIAYVEQSFRKYRWYKLRIKATQYMLTLLLFHIYSRQETYILGPEGLSMSKSAVTLKRKRLKINTVNNGTDYCLINFLQSHYL